jgi:bifunctional non-homologous end joining protein LigD
VRVEDHPLEYANFEGIIPKGEYGGGTVIVWDRGTWSPEGDAQAALRKGHLTFTLEGEKLHGRFHLARTRLDGGKRENWLLFKGKDAAADNESDIVAERPESALSGRTLEEVADNPARVWHSNRDAKADKAKPKVAKKPTGSTAVAAKKSPSVKQAKSSQERTPDVLALVKRLPLNFALTNLEKVLYPELPLRKGELIAYFAAVASYALPHLADRPLTLVRCPSGRGKKCFYQKHANEGVPDVVKRITIQEDKKQEEYMAVNDLPGLVALAQLGALELHTWVCHIDNVERPDQFVFDIDPDESLGFERVVEAALTTRARLADLGLECFVKTTGGKGLHVVAPVARKLDWDAHKEVAKAVAESIAKDAPNLYLTNMRKSLRKGKIFLDYLRNGRGATAVAPYSTRAREGATVAMPVSWEEIEQGLRPSDFSVYTVSKRLGGGSPDPWKDYAQLKQSLRAPALRKLGVRV